MSATGLLGVIFRETVRLYGCVTYIMTPFMVSCPIAGEPVPFLTSKTVQNLSQ
jgi:hypothetical protein